MTDFSALELSAPLLRAIEKQGFTAPTEIQSAAIPTLMEGKDLIGVAQTGGGKTAAFVLPMLEKLSQHKSKPASMKPRALILAPTRELASQIGNCIRDFSKPLRLFHTVVFGGNPFGPQVRALRRGVDVLVATPGRLNDHLRRGTVSLDDVEIFVLDEADRMLDMGFVDEVMEMASLLPEPHQTIMFSATMSKGVRRLAEKILTDPVQVEAAKQSTVATTIDHRVLFVANENKRPLLTNLLEKEEEVERVLVFTKTRMDADKLAETLDDEGHAAQSIHGDKPQRVRERVLRNFRNGRFKILVATDVAARGIDVQGITHVVNFDMPLEPESYVHRVGRTGRAGSSGIAISFCDNRERRLLNDIERVISQQVRVDNDHPFPLPERKPRRLGGKGGGKPGGQRRRFSGGPRGEGGFMRDGDGEKRFAPSGKKFGGKKKFGDKKFRGKRTEAGYKEGGDKPFRKPKTFRKAS